MLDSLVARLRIWVRTPATGALMLLAALLLAIQGARVLYPPAGDRSGWLWFAGAAILAAWAFETQRRREGEPVPPARPARYAPLWRLGLGLLLVAAGVGLAVFALVSLARTGNHEQMRWVWLGSLAAVTVGSYVLGGLGPSPGALDTAPEPEGERAPLKSETSLGTAADDVRTAETIPVAAATEAPIAEQESLRQDKGSQASRRKWGLMALEVLGVLILVALAIWLRVDRLRQMPPGIFVDETNAALDAIRIMEGRPDSPFGTGWFETPTMYAFYLVGLFRAFGTTFVALKVASILPSVLTVAAIYPLARLMFGIPTAFAATFILATNRWHLTMSRWGWNEVAPLLFMIVALFFLVRALRDRRAGDFAVGGLMLGLGHYTYLASRLVTLTVALYLLYRIVLQRGFLRQHWRGLVLLILAYLVAFGPLLQTYVQDPFTFTNRSQQVSIMRDMEAAYVAGETAPAWLSAMLRAIAGGGADGESQPSNAQGATTPTSVPGGISLEPLRESVVRHLEMMHVAGDRNPRHNLPEEPMLDPVTGTLLLLILGFALWQSLRPQGRKEAARASDVLGGHRYALTLLWLLVPMLGGVLTRLDEAPQAYRTLPIIGAIALLAGDAAVRSSRVFASAIDPRGSREGAEAGEAGSHGTTDGYRAWLRVIPAVLVAALLVGAGVYNYRLFFDVQAQDGRVWQAFSPVETTVATEVAGKMDTHSLYLSPRLYHFSPLKYLTYRPLEEGGGGLDEPAYRLAEPVTDLPLNDPFGQDALFLLDLYYQDVPEVFLGLYPGTQFELVEGPGGQPLYLSVTVPGDEVRALQGMRGFYVLGEGQPVVEQAYGGAPRFRWPDDLAAGGTEAGSGASARWLGSLQAPDSGMYSLELDGPGRLWIDGALWAGPRFLGKGLHALEIEQTDPAAASGSAGTESGAAATEITLSWLRPGSDAPEPVPPNFFFQINPSSKGLRAAYYGGELWEGDPVFERVDPLLLFAWPESEPWTAPFSVRWTGTLEAAVEGTYRFKLDADDGVRFWIDGQLMGESVVPDNVNLVDVSVPLAAGPHQVQVDYFQRGGGKALEFWWQPPGDHLRPVPPHVLTPAEAS